MLIESFLHWSIINQSIGNSQKKCQYLHPMPNISKTLWWNLLLFDIWWDIFQINSYIKSDVNWNFPGLIDYWLITKTPLWFHCIFLVLGQYLRKCLINFVYILLKHASWGYIIDNLDPLGYFMSIDTPNMAKIAEQEVGFAKQEVESYLGNGVS